MSFGHRMASLRTSRTRLPTRRDPTEYPGRKTSACAVGAERLPTSTTVIFVVARLPHPMLGQGRPIAMSAEGTQIDENTTTWLPSRNIVLGQPSISSLPASARLCGGQLVAVNNVRPERTKMRVPSFLTKSASSTPATCVLVVL